MEKRPLEVLPERRLPGGAARLPDADRGRDDRLVRAALGCERHPARRADQDRLAARVHAEGPRLERPPDERVVDRADRQERLAVAAPGCAELAQQPDQVGLGDPQLDVMAARRLVPVDERLGVVGKPVPPFTHRPDLALVDPAPEVRRAGDVGAHSDHALGHLAGLVDEIYEEAAEGLLSGSGAAVLSPELGRNGGRRPRLGLVARERGGRRGAQLSLGARWVERRPGLVGVGAEHLGQLDHLVARQQRGMVLGMALDRQRPALDRVGEDHRRAVRLDGPVGLDQLGRVVAAEVAHRRAQLGVGQLHHEPRELGVGRRGEHRQPLAQFLWRRAQKPLVLLVGHLVDAPAQLLAAGQLEQRAEPRAVLDRDGLPAGGVEHVRPAPERDVGHHAIERLAVEVDHPQDLAELGHARVGDRLPDGPLVELGVSHQCDLAAHRRSLEAVVLQVAAGERAPDRRGGADPHGAGRVVDGIGVLGPARIALQPAEGPQRLEVGLFEAAEQVVDRVQHGRRVRLDRHAVLRAQLGEPEGAHQADHRRRRGLMAAHLDPALVLADAVCVMNDRRGEPEHAPLDRPQGLEVRRRGLRRRRNRGL